MKKTVMTFGDSNTHGIPPKPDSRPMPRFGVGVRWPTIMQQALGADWALLEDGLPGRTTARACPFTGAHMNGQMGLRIALESQGPIDFLTIMLGTNDMQTQHGATPEMITGSMASLLRIAQSEDYQARHGGFDILLICPPFVLEEGTFAVEFQFGAAKSQALPMLYATLADRRGVHFLNAGQFISTSPIDGVHFDAQAHAVLGQAVADKIMAL